MHWPKRGQTGTSVAEMALVLAIVGILTAIGTPLFLTYYQGSRLRVAAQEIATFLNQGRQFAIRQNGNMCVAIASSAVQYRQGNCAAAAWFPVGVGLDAAGNLNGPAGITLAKTADPIFNYLGAATPGATITVTNTQNAATLRVCVAPSGRITVTPTATACP